MKKSLPHLNELWLYRNHIYIIIIVKFSNRSIQNLFNVNEETGKDSRKPWSFFTCSVCIWTLFASKIPQFTQFYPALNAPFSYFLSEKGQKSMILGLNAWDSA